MKMYTAQTSSLRVDRIARRISGVAIIDKGQANGDAVDDETLSLFARLGAAGSIRARFDHPNRANPAEVEQSMANLLGEWTGWSIDGPTLRAEVQFAGVNREKEEIILDFAEKAPHLFGVSVVFDDTPLPKGKKPKTLPPCRPTKFFAADFVDIPAANAAGLFAALAAESNDMEPADIYAKDGKLFCMADGKEVALNHTAESLDCTKSMMKAAKAKDAEGEGDEGETNMDGKKKAAEKTTEAEPVDAEKIRHDAVEGERTYRKMFGTVIKSAGLTGEAAEDFEETFYGRDEKDLKFLASHAIGTRAKPVGEGSGAGEQEQREPTDAAKAEADAGKRFDDEPAVRSMYGHHINDRESQEYKSARGRHVAAARRRMLSQG